MDKKDDSHSEELNKKYTRYPPLIEKTKREDASFNAFRILRKELGQHLDIITTISLLQMNSVKIEKGKVSLSKDVKGKMKELLYSQKEGKKPIKLLSDADKIGKNE